MKQATIGRWAFIIGLIVSVLLGFATFSYATLILVILGLIVGFMNVSDSESHDYLVAVIALMVVGVAGLQALAVFGSLYTWVQTVLASFIVFVAASSVVVAVKVLLGAAKEVYFFFNWPITINRCQVVPGGTQVIRLTCSCLVGFRTSTSSGSTTFFSVTI